MDKTKDQDSKAVITFEINGDDKLVTSILTNDAYTIEQQASYLAMLLANIACGMLAERCYNNILLIPDEELRVETMKFYQEYCDQLFDQISNAEPENTSPVVSPLDVFKENAE